MAPKLGYTAVALLIEQSTKVTARPASSWKPFAAYLVASAVLFPLYRYQIGADGISYVSIARHYLDGHWSEAVNLYWAPLYSWLLMIPMSMRLDPLMALRVVSIATGALALLAFARLARRFELSPQIEALCLWTAAVMILSFSIRGTPDLLVSAILLLYFSNILDSRYPEDRVAGVYCGLAGGIAFLAKEYALVFFTAHFVLLNALHWWRAGIAGRRGVVRNFIVGFAIFVAFAGSWVAVMSYKHGRFTVPTTGEFNRRLVGPESRGFPQYLQLHEPPNPVAISYWEEPSPADLAPWNPFSRDGMRQQARLLWANFKELLAYWQEASILSFGFLFAYCLWGLSTPGARVPWYFVLITVLTYPLGYLMIVLQDRYLWPVTLLFVLIGGVIVEAALSSGWASGAARKTLIAGFVVSFLFLPLRLTVGERNDGRSSFELSRQIRQRYPLHGNIAACANWNDSLYLAYYLNLRFLGDTELNAHEQENATGLNPNLAAPPTALSSGEAAAELAGHNVDYYLAWKNCAAIPPPVLEHEDITRGELSALKIYRLK